MKKEIYNGKHLKITLSKGNTPTHKLFITLPNDEELQFDCEMDEDEDEVLYKVIQDNQYVKDTYLKITAQQVVVWFDHGTKNVLRGLGADATDEATDLEAENVFGETYLFSIVPTDEDEDIETDWLDWFEQDELKEDFDPYEVVDDDDDDDDEEEDRFDEKDVENMFDKIIHISEPHIDFRGVPITGKGEIFVQQLEQLGFSHIESIDDNVIRMQGPYAGIPDNKINILSTPITHTVYQIIVEGQSFDNTADLIHEFLSIYGAFVHKYESYGAMHIDTEKLYKIDKLKDLDDAQMGLFTIRTKGSEDFSIVTINILVSDDQDMGNVLIILNDGEGFMKNVKEKERLRKKNNKRRKLRTIQQDDI